MSHEPANLKELKAIVEWVGVTGDVRELSLKYGDVELFVSRNQDTASSRPQSSSAPVQPSPAAPAPIAPAKAPEAAVEPETSASDQLAADEVAIKAPMVGTFYAAPKPGAAPFVTVGDVVKPDTVLCIVEVMKLMNNIEAGVEGTVARILVKDEQAVEYGQPLMVIKRNA